MTEKNYLLVRVKSVSGSSSYLKLRDVAYHCGVHPELVGRFVDLGLLDIADRDISGEALFEEDVVHLVRKILRLRNELGVNYAGIGVVLELMAKIDALEARIRELESRIFSEE
jgi:MerR family transcriptional regulator/heat shock protein HspR